jgi:alpha-glucosidase
MTPKILLFLSLLFVSIHSSGQSQAFRVKSPDQKLEIKIEFVKNGAHSGLTYEVNFVNKPIVLNSRLGISSGIADWEKDMNASIYSTSTMDTAWKPVYGERSAYRDHYNESVISLKHVSSDRKEMRLIVRAYNEGIAFRYFFPEHPEGGNYVHITSEQTEFKMPEGTVGYYTPFAQSKYQLLPLTKFPGESERPLSLVLPGGLYACLAEAEMVNYSRTKFITDLAKPNSLFCKMYGDVDEVTPFKTPWRVIMVAEKPGELLENNYLILNLNPANQIKNPEWIKPGKVMREVTLTAKGARDLVDFAVKRNLQYIHFDAGWYGYEYVTGSDASRVSVDPRRNPKSDLDLPAAIRYARSKGIGVILYVNQRALQQQLDEILPLYKQWGIAGIKFGFVQVGSHRWTSWMHDAVRKCAKYNLLVDIHDEYRPTGFSRTYPNLMTQEGVRGNEEMPDADNNTTLPFTRYVAGAADYTICYYKQRFGQPAFDADGKPIGRVIQTTSAHQLALAAIYYSPLQYMYWYDKPSDSKNEPELEFFDKVPTVWDDTKVLQGEIGKFISVARRSGNDWFVGTITNNDARDLSVSFDFLPEGKKYEASLYYDDLNAPARTKVGIRKMTVDRKTKIAVSLVASGGQAIMLTPLK